MDKVVLKVLSLTKKFGNYKAVNNISFEIKEGEIVGLLGPNGAGKTTTINMLLGLTTPTSGKIEIFGQDLKSHRAEILQNLNFASAYNWMQGRLTVFENLNVFANLYNISRPKEKINNLLTELKISDLKNSTFNNLSAGQRTRVVLAKALINRPKLLLLDEPTASLDPEFTLFIQDLFLKINKDYQVSMLYTSHNMEEVSRMCDRIIFLNKGRIVACDTPLNLTKKIQKTILVLAYDGKEKIIWDYVKNENLKAEFPKNHLVEVEVEEDEIPKIMINLSELGIWITEVDIKRPTLSDVFLEIAKTKLKEEEVGEEVAPRGRLVSLFNKIFKKKN